MRNLLYNILSLFSSPFRWYNSEKLRVLAYHGIPNPEAFERQILYLRLNYSLIDLQALQDHIFSNKTLPKNAVLLTFDDGDISVLTNGLPILKKFDIPAILFVITGLIGTEKPFWWDEIEYYLGKIKGRKKVWEVKGWPNHKREEYLQGLRNGSSKAPVAIQLSTSDLELLHKSGIVIANHSHTHPMFDNCSIEELETEFKNSKSILNASRFCGNVFAYPNGNHSGTTEKMLRKEEIKLAFLFDHKINDNELAPLRISRIMVDADLGMVEFKAKISGVHPSVFRMLKR